MAIRRVVECVVPRCERTSIPQNISHRVGRPAAAAPPRGSSELSLLTPSFLAIVHSPPARGAPAALHLLGGYWTMLTSVPSISSAVVIVRELAWKPRSAV